MGRDQYLLHGCWMKADPSIFSSWTRSGWHIKGFCKIEIKWTLVSIALQSLDFKRRKNKQQIVSHHLQRIKVTLLGLEHRSFYIMPAYLQYHLLPLSMLISHSNKLSVTLYSGCVHTVSFAWMPFSLPVCQLQLMYLKTQLKHHFPFCSLNSIISRRRSGV